VKREGILPVIPALRLCRQVAIAIGAAHERGIIHRDLKPENIFVVRDPEVTGGERAKVLDFGVAKLVEDRPRTVTVQADPESHPTMTMAGTIVGTPAYMAPEQLRAEMPDARTDVFALGVIAYEMLGGDLPYSRGTLTDVVLAQAQGARPLVERDPAIPAPLSQAVMRAVALDAHARPRSARAFADELSAALAALS